MDQPIQRDSDAKSHEIASSRFRLHLLSWIVFVVMTICMTIIVVPGIHSRSVEYELPPMGGGSFGTAFTKVTLSDYKYIEVDTWNHGWPFEYMRRPFIQSTYLIGNNGVPIMWTSLAAWRSSGKIYSYNYRMLLVDLIIGLAIVACTVVACEFWRRRRRGYRFSLLDVGVLLTIVCLVLGWQKFHSTARAQEQKAVANMKERASLGRINGNQFRVKWYCQGPLWLRRLVGNPFYLSFCNHVGYIRLDPAELSSEDYFDLCELEYIQTALLPNSKLKSAFREQRTS